MNLPGPVLPMYEQTASMHLKSDTKVVSQSSSTQQPAEDTQRADATNIGRLSRLTALDLDAGAADRFSW